MRIKHIPDFPFSPFSIQEKNYKIIIDKKKKKTQPRIQNLKLLTLFCRETKPSIQIILVELLKYRETKKKKNFFVGNQTEGMKRK